MRGGSESMTKVEEEKKRSSWEERGGVFELTEICGFLNRSYSRRSQGNPGKGLSAD